MKKQDPRLIKDWSSFSSRKEFLKKIGLAAAGGLLLPSFSWLKNDEDDSSNKLVILHTNDMHSRVDPFPVNDPKYPDQGGMARRAELVNRIRSKEQHVLLLDCGDIFQGTPYFNLYGGKVEFKIMSMMQYDAATMGNHDFDNGLEGFDAMLPHASFPFICSNYDFTATILKDKTKPYLIIEKGPWKIGIIGLGIQLKGLVADKNYGKTIYLDPIETGDKIAGELKQKGCNLVICLSHLGYSYKSEKISDLLLARNTKHIDLILGGHTHTFLESATPVLNKNGKPVYINQAGWGGLRLGRIDLELTRKRRKEPESTEISYLQGSNLWV